jgi:hypothetical protein
MKITSKEKALAKKMMQLSEQVARMGIVEEYIEKFRVIRY